MKPIIFNENEIESFKKKWHSKIHYIKFGTNYWCDTILCVSLYQY